MTLIETHMRREDERLAWREHRRREATAWEAAWLSHVNEFSGVRGFSDAEKVRNSLLGDGLLRRLADRPTLRLDDVARDTVAGLRRAWHPEEICDL